MWIGLTWIDAGCFDLPLRSSDLALCNQGLWTEGMRDAEGCRGISTVSGNSGNGHSGKLNTGFSPLTVFFFFTDLYHSPGVNLKLTLLYAPMIIQWSQGVQLQDM